MRADIRAYIERIYRCFLLMFDIVLTALALGPETSLLLWGLFPDKVAHVCTCMCFVSFCPPSAMCIDMMVSPGSSQVHAAL